ncbi:MAG: diguanylate cyclase [Planctomycetota bacterium]|nr:diguanylate cyclase [Planctomycetota bacterium]
MNAASPGGTGTPRRPDEPRQVVLIVDDSPDVHRLLRIKLRNLDLDLLHAYRGDEALELIARTEPDAILLDLDMPGIDGLGVLRRLKENDRTQHIPVIIISGMKRAEDKVAAFEIGASDFVTKPFDLTELRVRLQAALRLRQLLSLLAHRAQLDGLTGLWNRAFFEERWTQEHARAVRHVHPLSLAILDLDHFKSINDTRGHPVGDGVLEGLARILRRESRQTDCPCRYGGEEFALIMPDTHVQDALLVCERIRSGVEATVFNGCEGMRVTVSIGVVGASAQCDLPPAEWVRAADANLYAAKNAGRNRVVATELQAAGPHAPRLAA